MTLLRLFRTKIFAYKLETYKIYIRFFFYYIEHQMELPFAACLLIANKIIAVLVDGVVSQVHVDIALQHSTNTRQQTMFTSLYRLLSLNNNLVHIPR